MILNALKKDFKLALIQAHVGKDKGMNLERTATAIQKVAQAGANMVILGECFNSPYGNAHFRSYAEDLNQEDSPTKNALSKLSKKFNLYIIGGSIPERDSSGIKFMNTSMTFAPTGELIHTYRKVTASSSS